MNRLVSLKTTNPGMVQDNWRSNESLAELLDSKLFWRSSADMGMALESFHHPIAACSDIEEPPRGNEVRVLQLNFSRGVQLIADYSTSEQLSVRSLACTSGYPARI
jgi:hypothetical protein